MAYDETDTAEELEADGGDGGGYGGAEFVAESAPRAKNDVYTLILVLSFVAFLIGTVLAMRELWLYYDVEFWMFKRK